MPKKKKKSGWTLKPGESVEDWREARRARMLAQMTEEERSRFLERELGFRDQMYTDDSD